MVGFIPHVLQDIVGIEINEIVFFNGKHNFMVRVTLTFKNGRRSDPFALCQVDGIRRTLDSQGNNTTLREVVYGKTTAIKWLDKLFDKVGQQLSEGIGRCGY
jgi:hypothetical protein